MNWVGGRCRVFPFFKKYSLLHAHIYILCSDASRPISVGWPMLKPLISTSSSSFTCTATTNALMIAVTNSGLTTSFQITLFRTLLWIWLNDHLTAQLTSKRSPRPIQTSSKHGKHALVNLTSKIQPLSSLCPEPF